MENAGVVVACYVPPKAAQPAEEGPSEVPAQGAILQPPAEPYSGLHVFLRYFRPTGHSDRALAIRWAAASAEEKRPYEDMAQEVRKKWLEDQLARRSKQVKWPRTGYQFFYDREKAALRREHPEMKAGDLQRAVQMKWKAMSENHRRQFQPEADRDKERYEAELQSLKRELNDFLDNHEAQMIHNYNFP